MLASPPFAASAIAPGASLGFGFGLGLVGPVWGEDVSAGDEVCCCCAIGLNDGGWASVGGRGRMGCADDDGFAGRGAIGFSDGGALACTVGGWSGFWASAWLGGGSGDTGRPAGLDWGSGDDPAGRGRAEGSSDDLDALDVDATSFCGTGRGAGTGRGDSAGAVRMRCWTRWEEERGG